MKAIFVDTSHLVASVHPRDPLHDRAKKVELEFRNIPLITSDLVLVELLNYFCEFSEHYKRRIVRAVDAVIANPRYSLIECSQATFLAGKEFYATRLDHTFSLTDCVSMNIMRGHGINEVLTNDDHFKQEGFRILL
jgi:predicted nucleic acid-binding protein